VPTSIEEQPLIVGFISKQPGLKRPVWCVHNEPTGRIIHSKGRERCYRTKAQALDVWSKLDCHYTKRLCELVPVGFQFPEPVRRRR
jgi:hypothetical protein